MKKSMLFFQSGLGMRYRKPSIHELISFFFMNRKYVFHRKLLSQDCLISTSQSLPVTYFSSSLRQFLCRSKNIEFIIGTNHLKCGKYKIFNIRIYNRQYMLWYLAIHEQTHVFILLWLLQQIIAE